MLFRISESLVNIGQFLKINEIANCFAQSSFVVKIAQTFSIWRSKIGLAAGKCATRKRRTCDCATCDGTETISSADRTSQIAATPSSGLRGSPVFPCRTPSSRFARFLTLPGLCF
jgi:hypothetical protein